MTFSTGNYNEFEELVTLKMPGVSETIRNNILPKIENVLNSMLKGMRGVRGKSLNVEPSINQNNFMGFICTIIYEVEDFNVPEAPKEAIQEDVDNISKAIADEINHLKEVTINTSTGLLTIVYEIPLSFDEE